MFIEEYKIFMPLLNVEMTTDFIDVDAKLFNGYTAYWHKPFFITFSKDFHKANIGMQVCNFKINKLRYAQAAAIQSFQHGFIANALRLAQINGSDYCIDVVHA